MAKPHGNGDGASSNGARTTTKAGPSLLEQADAHRKSKGDFKSRFFRLKSTIDAKADHYMDAMEPFTTRTPEYRALDQRLRRIFEANRLLHNVKVKK